MKTAKQTIEEWCNDGMYENHPNIEEAIKAYAREAIKADRENVTKYVRIRVTPYDIEEYDVTSVKHTYLETEHQDGYELEINMETILLAPEIELL